MINTLCLTILWIAEERFMKGGYTNINSAIHSVIMDISLELQKVMSENYWNASKKGGIHD